MHIWIYTSADGRNQQDIPVLQHISLRILQPDHSGFCRGQSLYKLNQLHLNRLLLAGQPVHISMLQAIPVPVPAAYNAHNNKVHFNHLRLSYASQHRHRFFSAVSVLQLQQLQLLPEHIRHNACGSVPLFVCGLCGWRILQHFLCIWEVRSATNKRCGDQSLFSFLFRQNQNRFRPDKPLHFYCRLFRVNSKFDKLIYIQMHYYSIMLPINNLSHWFHPLFL